MQVITDMVYESQITRNEQTKLDTQLHAYRYKFV